MLKIRVVAYRDERGTVPFLNWIDGLRDKQAIAKCWEKIELLAASGHELDRPAAAYLQSGIYELRPKVRNVRYRILYFFSGPKIAVFSHGFAKKQARVPIQEIRRAEDRKVIFRADPKAHTGEVDL